MALGVGLALVLIASQVGCSSTRATNSQDAPTIPNEPRASVYASLQGLEAGITDEQGDVADRDGKMPAVDKSGTDLVSVTLTGNDKDLVVRIETATQIPADSGLDGSGLAESISWVVYAGVGYQLGMQLLGTEWFVYTADLVRGKQANHPGQPTLSAKSMTARFPLANMPRLGSHFRWRAVCNWGEGGRWFDYAPDAVSDNAYYDYPTAPFPG